MTVILYRIIYASACLIPANNSRQRKRRAQMLADGVREFTARYCAVGVALAANFSVVVLLSLVSWAVAAGSRDDEIDVTLGGFVHEQMLLRPPDATSPASSVKVQHDALRMMLASPVSDPQLAVISTSAASSLSVQAVIPSPLSPASDSFAVLHPVSGDGDRGRGGESGTASGKGRSASRAIGERAWGATKTVRGNTGPGWVRPGRDGFEDQKMVLIVDYTLRTPSENRIKADIQNVIDGLKRRNDILGELSCYSGVMTAKSGLSKDTVYGDMMDSAGNVLTAFSDCRRPRDRDSQDCPEADRVNAYWCIRDAVERYAGQKAALVVISDFVEGAPNSAEEIESLAKALIKAELRLYLVTVDNAPPPTARIIAYQTAGETRRMRVESFAEYIRGKEDAIPWADVDYLPLRHLDRAK